MRDPRPLITAELGLPWGDDPPPAPPTATEAERERVRWAWQAWSPFSPAYRREGEAVWAEVNLKDNIFRGRGSGETDAAAAWNALQALIEGWEPQARAALAAHARRKQARRPGWLGRGMKRRSPD